MVTALKPEPSPVLHLVPSSAGKNAHKFNDLPDAALYGWARDYVDLMLPTTEAAPQFHLATALTLMGAMVGRRIRVQGPASQLYPNLCTLLVGASYWSRKDTAADRGEQMIDAWIERCGIQPEAEPFKVAETITTSEGLIKQLADYPNMLVRLGEFSELLDHMKQSSRATIRTTLLKAYNNPRKLENLSKSDPITAHNPTLSILALTQPKVLADGLQSTDVASGFLNRFLIIPGHSTGPKSRAPMLDEGRAAALCDRLRQKIMAYPDGTVIHLTEEAWSHWDVWYAREFAQHAFGDDEDDQDMSGRRDNLVMKLALLHAIGDGSKAAELHHLTAAFALANWVWAHVQRMSPNWGANPDTQFQNKVIELLKDAPEQMLPCRHLQQNVRYNGPGTRKLQIIDTLVKADVLEYVEQTVGTSRKATKFVRLRDA